MSRYIKHLEDGGFVAYGYDEPLREYFIQLFDEKENCIFSIGSHWITTLEHPDYPGKTRWSNSDLLSLFQKYSLPLKHTQMLIMDLPF